MNTMMMMLTMLTPMLDAPEVLLDLDRETRPQGVVCRYSLEKASVALSNAPLLEGRRHIRLRSERATSVEAVGSYSANGRAHVTAYVIEPMVSRYDCDDFGADIQVPAMRLCKSVDTRVAQDLAASQTMGMAITFEACDE